MGVGFVGAVMAAIIADTVDKKTGKPSKFVIGCQRPSPRSYWKIPMLNRGESPVKAEDPEVDPMIARCVQGEENAHRHVQQRLPRAGRLRGGRRAVRLHQARAWATCARGEAEMSALEATMRTIGQKVQPHCLTLIETTVAPGTTEFVAWPIMKKAFAARGIKSEPLLGPQFRARDAGPRIRLFDPRFLAGLFRLQRRGPAAGGEVPPRGAQHRTVPADGDGSADRVGNHQDRRELLPGDDPGVPERMEPVRRAQRRRPDQGRSRPSRCGPRTAT